MAQFAIGKSCPTCGSLLTYAGNQNDPDLAANCFVCGQTYTQKNADYVGPMVCSECGQPATLVAPPSPAVVVGEKPVDNPVLPDAETPDTSGSSASGE